MWSVKGDVDDPIPHLVLLAALDNQGYVVDGPANGRAGAQGEHPGHHPACRDPSQGKANQCSSVPAENDTVLSRGPLQEIRVFCLGEAHVLSPNEVDVRDTATQPADDVS